MTDKTLTNYADLPPAMAKHLAALEDLICDLDGKTLCSDATGDNGEHLFADEGTIVSDDYVEHFNGIVASARELQRQLGNALAAGD